MVLNVCNECMQYSNEKIKCICYGGEISSKKIALVNGCIKKNNDNIRCKKERIYDMYICEEHYINDKKYLDKINSIV